MKPVIELDNVSKNYRLGDATVHALDHANLKIMRKDFISLMGPSGSGKSTLLHMMGALDRPDTGNLYIEGTNLTSLTDDQIARIRGKNIGFIFQFFNLYPSITAVENVELPMEIMEVDKVERRERAMKLLEMVGLGERALHLPSQLSGGQRQRVAIARALANDPSFILADEPTGNLDSKNGHDVMQLLVDLNKKEGKTIVIATHDPSIASHSKKTIKIKDGKITIGGKA